MLHFCSYVKLTPSEAIGNRDGGFAGDVGVGPVALRNSPRPSRGLPARVSNRTALSGPSVTHAAGVVRGIRKSSTSVSARSTVGASQPSAFARCRKSRAAMTWFPEGMKCP